MNPATIANSQTVRNLDAPLIEEARQCLERFTLKFNACDTAGIDAELYFPHVMISGEGCLIWETPGRHTAEFFTDLLNTGWAKTVYTKQTAVLVSREKVHFLVEYNRIDQRGNTLSQHSNLWILLKTNSTWKIALRSY